MDVLQSIFATIFMVEFVMGNLGNGFIALVNCMQWVKRRKISTLSLILTALAISRIGLLWLVLLNWFGSAFYPALLMIENVLRITYVTWTVTSHFSTWLATCLGIFYFLKIANFSNSLFLCLKWRVKEMVLMTLLVSLPLLFLNIIILNTNVDIWIDRSKRNTSNVKNYPQFSKLFLVPNLMFTLIPFTVTLVTFLMLIFSLWRHLKNMQLNTQGFRDVSTIAHVKALKMVVVFLFLYIVFLLSILTEIWKFGSLYKNLIISFGQASVLAFPSIHSCMLILGHRNLQQASLSVLLWLRYCHKNPQDS